jgi:hypothetical protein
MCRVDAYVNILYSFQAIVALVVEMLPGFAWATFVAVLVLWESATTEGYVPTGGTV